MQKSSPKATDEAWRQHRGHNRGNKEKDPKRNGRRLCQFEASSLEMSIIPTNYNI